MTLPINRRDIMIGAATGVVTAIAVTTAGAASGGGRDPHPRTRYV